ncbi:hypothetical protein BDA96_04G022900 [Sorghum bicolor]|uniref:Uncharacterized protein n=1 Tax=Sorghum bicolor TaxID=4558 RepID=A0A921R2T8_SORBI|nr:hypothetical protein BDA96_04G022900 [Sorghum bicolor]
MYVYLANDALNYVSTRMEDVDWDELLPHRQWKRYDTRTWEEFMPPPSQQLSEVLPAAWGGSCAVHSYSEAMTANLHAVILWHQ